MERNVRKIKQRLRREGWQSGGGKRGKGSHEFFTKPNYPPINVPTGHRGELQTGLAQDIARKAGWQ